MSGAPGPLGRGGTSAAPSQAGLIRALLRWFRSQCRDLPWRRTRDPYAIWVSEIMLQQTQVQTVIPYWQRWMRALPTLRALARARPQRVLKLWEGLGYYTRARNLHRAARQILAERRGRMPERFEDLLALPGVGRYTAGAICSMAFNQPAPVLDGNVTRVLSRLFCLRGHPGRPARRARLWRLAGQLVGQAAALQAGSRASGTLPAPPNCSHLNQALMELGAVICTPRRPKCPVCPVRDRCRARAAGLAEKLPSPRPVARPTLRRVAAFVVRRRGRYLVRQRDARGVNARLWEFPTVEREGEGPPSRALAGACLGAPAGSLRPLLELRHSITRHRIVLEVFEAGLASGARPSRAAGRWRTPAQLRRLPFTAAHRKILARLERRPS